MPIIANPPRARGEPPGRLDGVVYEGPLGRIEIIGTVVTDRGPGAAERVWGADFCITASLQQAHKRVRKAALGQAKRGPIERQFNREQARLDKQCQDMRQATAACVILETPSSNDWPVSVRIIDEEYGERMSLADYLVDYTMTCAHGDSRDDFVFASLTSRLSGLHIAAEQAD